MKVRFSRFLIVFWLLMAPACIISMQARGSAFQSESPAMKRNVTIHLRPMVLYSDMDVWDKMKNPEFKASDIGWGGMGEVSYSHPIHKVLLMRVNLGGGYYQGDATILKNEHKGKYQGYFGEIGAGIEYVPFKYAGFYTFFGLGINVNYVSIIKYNAQDSQNSLDAENTWQYLPFFPVEVGYKFSLAQSIDLGLAIYTHIGMVDKERANLDGYGGYDQSKFSDGYIGISVDLAFHTGKDARYGTGKHRHNKRRCNCFPW